MKRWQSVSAVIRLCLLWLCLSPFGSPASGQSLEQQLERHSTKHLARRARLLGDPVRGAKIFFQSGLACHQCHAVGDREGDRPDVIGYDAHRHATALALLLFVHLNGMIGHDLRPGRQRGDRIEQRFVIP